MASPRANTFGLTIAWRVCASTGTATPISSARPGSTHPLSGAPASQPSGMPNPSRMSPAPPYTAAAPVRLARMARVQGGQPRRAATGGRAPR